jgi:hypothetical protein
MTIHGNAFGIGAWASARDVEIYGTLIFDNGWEGPDRGHGHGIYTQNQIGTKWIRDNFVFDQFGGGLHVYGSEVAYLDGYRIEGNTIFNNGSLSALSGFSRNILFGGGRVATSSSIEGNFTYFPSDRRQGDNNIGYRAGTRDVTVTGNYFAGGHLAIIGAGNLQLTDNLLYLNVPVVVRNSYPDNTYVQSRPSSPAVFVRRNEFDQDRSHVIVYNWNLRDTVAIDPKLADLSIDECYEIRNVQNYFGPPATGRVTGDSIAIPLAGWEMREIPGGWTAPPSLPEFGAFIVTRAACPEPADPPLIEPAAFQ